MEGEVYSNEAFFEYLKSTFIDGDEERLPFSGTDLVQLSASQTPISVIPGFGISIEGINRYQEILIWNCAQCTLAIRKTINAVCGLSHQFETVPTVVCPGQFEASQPNEVFVRIFNGIRCAFSCCPVWCWFVHGSQKMIDFQGKQVSWTLPKMHTKKYNWTAKTITLLPWSRAFLNRLPPSELLCAAFLRPTTALSSQQARLMNGKCLLWMPMRHPWSLGLPSARGSMLSLFLPRNKRLIYSGP